MSKKDYEWKRFWCPRTGKINLDDGGYLCDPDAEWVDAHNRDLVSLEALADIPCLILLGEPGIGKSRAIKKEIENKVYERKQLIIDLHSYGSEDRLVTKLFESSQFRAWVEGNYLLYVFLDSLDECLLRIEHVTSVLADEFKQYQDKADRLFLRVACRSAVWQPTFEEQLQQIWGKDKVKVYELAPLRHEDVKRAAECEGIEEPDIFMQEIWDKRVVPLAIKPITLGFLIEEYLENGYFSQRQTLFDLYLRGCRRLCDEEDDSDPRRPGRKGNLELDQRLIISARIAAVTIFTKRSAIWSGGEWGKISKEDVLIRELAQGCERANSREVEITEVAIAEVLDTGLFSSRGLHRMGWAHQTYAEFLAAWYLVQHEVPLKKIRKLIFSSQDPDHKLIPQLHEAAAWLASMKPDILQNIVKTDPDVLLQTDVPTDAETRALIVDNLLKQYEEGKLFDRYRNYRNYVKLKHPGLANQLRPYICNSSKQMDARDLAIDIAEVCEISELQEELLKLALDSSESIDLRVSATKAIYSVGNATTKLKLKPLVIEQLAEDEDDQLKGYALRSLWPEHLTAEELFQVLTPPKKRRFSGGYQWFLDYELVPRLQPSDLVVALNWLKAQGLRCFGHSFEELGDDILFKAWENFDLPGVAEVFTKVALAQWKEYQELITSSNELERKFTESLSHDSARRRKLIKHAVLMISGMKGNPFNLLYSLVRNVVTYEDIVWMLGCIGEADSKQVQKNWTILIRRVFRDPESMPEEAKAILEVGQVNIILCDEFSYWIKTIDLDSAEGVKIYTAYLKEQTWQSYKQQRNNQIVKPLPKERVLQCLSELEAGDLSAWWRLNMEMTLKPESQYYENEFELDLTQLPGWQEADEATQRRIIEGAKKYIQQKDDLDYDWIGTNTFDLLALAGCGALHLLLTKNLDFLEGLSSEIWQKWAPVIIATPSSNQRTDPYLNLIKYAYLNAPAEFIKTLIILIDKENQEHAYISVINRLEKCWDEQLKLAFLEKAQDPSLKPKCIGQLLEGLLRRGETKAKDFAKALIISPLPKSENEREKALIAARLLIENSDPSSWSFIWEFIQKDSSFGREIFELVAYRYSHGIQLSLTEAQLADLYIWLVHEYPYDEDPDRSNEVMAYLVTARDGIVSLRNSVLSQLQKKGTLEACAEIERLIQELPDVTWLRKMLIDAQANMRRETWQPLEPEELLQLISNQDKRLVQNGQHLLEVLIESLERLELELQGETPAVRDLWDKGDSNSFRPVDENAFSDYVKRFFDRDLKSRGIIVNREVELRRGYGGNAGERTDIHVDAVLKHPDSKVHDRITVVIEVKGCWHSEVQTAMKTQLVERYLADNAFPYGLYLVGWFNCRQWDNSDLRKKQPRKLQMTLDEARMKFNDQAEELSSSGKLVRAYVLNAALR